MTAMKSVQEIIETLLPDSTKREAYLTIFADAIVEANIHGGDKWAVHLLDDRVRLIVGHNIICTIIDGRIWLALDQSLFPTAKIDLNQTKEWEWDQREYPEYSSIGSTNGYYTSSSQHTNIWVEIRRLLNEAIYQAAHRRKMDPRTPDKHNPEVLQYLRDELGKTIPDPAY